VHDDDVTDVEPTDLHLSLVFTMVEDEPPDGEVPIRYEVYRVLPVGETPMVCLVENDGDESSLMIVPVELLQAVTAALDDPTFA